MRWQSRIQRPEDFSPKAGRSVYPTDSLPRELPLRGFNFGTPPIPVRIGAGWWYGSVRFEEQGLDLSVKVNPEAM